MKLTMKKITFLSFVFAFLFFSPANAETVRVDFEDENFTVLGGSVAASTEAIYFERPSSSELGNDPENPLVVFMPIKTVDGHENSILFSDKTFVPTMENGNAYFSFYLKQIMIRQR